MPKISIIMPAYNAMLLISRAIDSVLAQSFSDFELIIIDDGSTDETSVVCGDYAARDQRITLISQENSGVSSARNAGIRAASGEYLAFLDSDDYLEPNACEKMLEAIYTFGANSCVCGYNSVSPEGEKTAVPFSLIINNSFTEKNNTADIQKSIIFPILCERLSQNPFLGTVWRYLFSAEIIKKNNITFSGAYLEDELFLIEYFSLEGALTSVIEPLYNYFQNPASATHRYMTDCEKTFLSSLNKKSALVEERKIPVPENWILSSAWAGLLICVSNEFAPGNQKSFFEKISAVRKICKTPEFKRALSEYKPLNMPRNKDIVARLLRYKLFFPLAILYTAKNHSKDYSL